MTGLVDHRPPHAARPGARGLALLTAVLVLLGVLTAPVRADDHEIMPGTVTVVGDLVPGSTLRAVTTPWAPGDVTVTYSWTVNGQVTGAGESLLVKAAMVGHPITVEATGEHPDHEAVRVEVTTDPVRTGTFTTSPPKITGSALTGSVLTVDTGTWLPKPGAHTFQWFLGGTPVPGATGRNFAVQPEHVGRSVRVWVTGERAGFVTATAISSPTAAVKPGPLKPGSVDIRGMALVDETVEAVATGWRPAATSYSYRWEADGKLVGTGRKLTVAPGLANKKLVVKVTGNRKNFLPSTAVGRPYYQRVQLGTMKVPKIATAGRLVVGGKLSVTVGKMAGSPTVSYRWFRNGVVIPGAKSASHTLTSASMGRYISVEVTVRRPGYHPITTGEVWPHFVTAGKLVPVTPVIAGTPAQTQVLEVMVGPWSPKPTFRYQWYRDGKEIFGAISKKYRVKKHDKGHTLKVTVTGTAPGYVTAVRHAVIKVPR